MNNYRANNNEFEIFKAYFLISVPCKLKKNPRYSEVSILGISSRAFVFIGTTGACKSKWRTLACEGWRRGWSFPSHSGRALAHIYDLFSPHD